VIFSAVFAVSVLMVVVLPQAARVTPALAAPPGEAVLEQALVEPAAADKLPDEQPPTGILPADPPAEDVPAQEEAAAPIVAEAQPPQPTPTEPPPPPAEVQPAPVNLQSASRSGDARLQEFTASLANGQPGQLVGVYVAGLFALRVVEQPPGDENFVSADGDVLTRYGKPGQFGVTAILAHNYLSGRTFFQIKPGQEIVLVYGNGQTASYRVSGIEHYQAISPHDVRSDFRDLNGPGGQVISYSQLFDRVYTAANTLVLQTCIEANGDPSWGRIFIIADPAA
jgi:hypothetical protein